MNANNNKGNQTMNNNTITHFEQRGTLTYMKPDFTFRTIDGWFYLNGSTVVMRKVRGRNHFNLCSEESVYQFTQAN